VNNEIRRNMALFPISIVMKLTDLTARQIRYYEEHALITPARTNGNQRLFSFNDIERLLEVKALIEKGVNMAGVKQVFSAKQSNIAEATVYDEKVKYKPSDLSDVELRRMLKQQLLSQRRPNQVLLNQGELNRVFGNDR